MSEQVRVEDDRGNPWRVSGGDPAMRHVNKLRRMHYRWVVLPLVTLATGDLGATATTPTDPLRATRLAECIGVLSSNS